MSLNILAWNNKIGQQCYFVGLRTVVMMNRDSCGYSYSVVRGGKLIIIIMREMYAVQALAS